MKSFPQKSKIRKTTRQKEQPFSCSITKFKRIRLSPVRFTGGFQMVDHPDKFLAGMRDCYVVVLTFAAFLGEIFGKCIIPIANKFRSVEKSVAQISGAAFLHMRV